MVRNRLTLASGLVPHAQKHLPLYVFMAAYFVTAVLGQLLYLTPYARDWPKHSIADWAGFPGQLGAGYWLLLALPFVAAPVIARLVSRSATPTATRLSFVVPELPHWLFATLCVGLMGYAVWALARADAIHLLLSPTDANDAVRARFTLLAALGRGPKIAILSQLVFLSIYAMVRAVRAGGNFWVASAAITTTSLTTCLIFMNMKWPVVVFILTIGMCVFAYSKNHQIIKSALIVAIGIIFYLGVSVALLRLMPTTYEARLETHPAASAAFAPSVASYVSTFVQTGVRSTPRLLISAVNRMAIAAPFYFDFASANPDCSQSVRRLAFRRDLACEPTLRVYSEMFRDDGFVGVGTAPAAVHLYGYALDGWVGAMISLGLASIIIGLYLALWPAAQYSAIYAAAFIMGGYTSYAFSQLPFEGAITYDHGMLWWMLLIFSWAAVYWFWRGARSMIRGHRSRST